MKKYIYTVNPQAEDAPAKILKNVGTGKRVLEVGCASGVQSRVLKEQQGCTITGIEIDPEAAQEARQYCESVIVGNLETLNFEEALGDRRYNVIVLADVLEHLRNPAQVLNGLKQFLDTGGYILASIPNIVHAGLILEMANGRFDYRPYGLLDDTHVRFFTLKGVYRLFQDCDLAINGLDRVRCSAEASEFYRHPYNDAEQTVLAYLKSNNPEWQTYQFIVTATLTENPAQPDSHAQLEYRDKLKDLELTNQALSKKINTLQSQIAWMEGHPAHRLYSRLRKFFK